MRGEDVPPRWAYKFVAAEKTKILVGESTDPRVQLLATLLALLPA